MSSMTNSDGQSAASKETSKVLPTFDDSDFFLSIEDVSFGAQIGQGAFSKVYVGKYMGELVAVKKQRRAVNDGLDTYLLRELSVLKHYEHPNLLNYIGASDVPGEGIEGANAIFIVTELAEHGDLLALLLGKHHLGWKLRVNILLDAARALEFLHSKSLIHRDIKSPNMLLDRNFNCKIADFGMARQVGSNMTIVGTDAYMAPELMFDEEYDASADMFSFGIVLWEAIYRKKAGQHGFVERLPSDRFQLNTQGLNFNAPEDTPPSLLMLAIQLCQYEATQRPSAEDTFLWLEDLYNEINDDGSHINLKPIDYEALFKSEPTFSIGRSKPRPVSLSVGTTATALSTARPPSSGSLPPHFNNFANPDARIDGNLGATRSSSGSLRGATHAPVTKCGFLYKKGKSGLKNWQKRWFVLEGTKLLWYKDSRSYPKEPRGYLDLKGCFIVRGLFFRWKILNADGAADQEDYNRDLAAKDAGEMEQWLTALQDAMDAADTGENLPPNFEGNDDLPRGSTNLGITLNKIPSAGLPSATPWSLMSEQSVEDWLESLNLKHLSEAFSSGGYTDMMLIQELGLNSEDFKYLKIQVKKERKLLKLAATGGMEKFLTVAVSGFYNFGAELVYRIDSRWRSLRASTFFRFTDFEELNRKVLCAIKNTKYASLMPVLPVRPTQSMLTLGSVAHAAQMARLQQDLHKYMDRLTTLVGNKEPFFTMLCGQLDLLPPDTSRLPERTDDFLAKMHRSLSSDSLQATPRSFYSTRSSHTGISSADGGNKPL